MKLADTHLVLLSAASQRPDRAVVLSPDLTGNAARKVLGRLIRERLLEEVPANGSLPAWRRDDEKGPLALCITNRGLETIGVWIDQRQADGESPNQTSVENTDRHPSAASANRTPAKASSPASGATRSRSKPTGRVSRKSPAKRIGTGLRVAAPARQKKSDGGSKQSHVIATLRSPKGATIDAMMKATGWQQHSVRGFLAGVVRKRLKLNLDSEKVDGDRVYRITGGVGRKPAAGKSRRRAA